MTSFLTAVVRFGDLGGSSHWRFQWALLPVIPMLRVVRAMARHLGPPLDVGAYSELVDNGWAWMIDRHWAKCATAPVEISDIADYRFDDLIVHADPMTSSRGELPSLPDGS